MDAFYQQAVTQKAASVSMVSAVIKRLSLELDDYYAACFEMARPKSSLFLSCCFI
jgi:hypothetical protein